MLFHISFEYSTANRDTVHERFKQTGAPPPDAVSMIGRWHAAGGNRGFLVAEASNASVVAAWLQEWTELIDFEVTPVLTDGEFRDVVA